MIETERLILRRWEERDRAPLHAICSNPRVMKFIGPPQSRAESDAAIDRQNGFLDTLGHCFWAVERRTDSTLLGFCGVKPGALQTPVEGELETGWRIACDHWGVGYAREAAQASLDWSWDHLTAPRVMAIVAETNARSWGLMKRIGMTRVPDGDFVDPDAAFDSPFRAAITYSISRPEGR